MSSTTVVVTGKRIQPTSVGVRMVEQTLPVNFDPIALSSEDFLTLNDGSSGAYDCTPEGCLATIEVRQGQIIVTALRKDANGKFTTTEVRSWGFQNAADWAAFMNAFATETDVTGQLLTPSLILDDDMGKALMRAASQLELGGILFDTYQLIDTGLINPNPQGFRDAVIGTLGEAAIVAGVFVVVFGVFGVTASAATVGTVAVVTTFGIVVWDIYQDGSWQQR
jgi:hypothetical protein